MDLEKSNPCFPQINQLIPLVGTSKNAGKRRGKSKQLKHIVKNEVGNKGLPLMLNKC
jgi:hypothetical protein